MAQQILSTNTFLASTWIVNSNATKGTHTTLAGAMASASSGDTILIQTSVTENVTLTPGVNITGYAWADVGTPQVSITGTLTMTGAGNVTISNIQLITNSANFLVVSGSANSVVNLFNCYLNSLNNTGISFTSSGTTTGINIYNCLGNIGTTGITCFVSTAATGTIVFFGCDIENSGVSVTASTISAGVLSIQYSKLIFPITTSSTAVFQMSNSILVAQPASNVTILTHGGSGANSVVFLSQLGSGSASCVSIGSTLTMANCVINSTNTNAITGAGTLINAGISFVNTSYKINTSTQTVAQLDVGGISFDGGTNLLQNYAQGTFTPTLVGVVVGTTTYVIQNGYYTRVGNAVTIIATLSISAATGTGNATFGGLPFTVNNSSNNNSIGTYYSSGTGWAWPAAKTYLISTPSQNTTTGTIQGCATVASVAFLQMSNAAYTAIIEATYQI